jgi:hypothetical protein
METAVQSSGRRWWAGMYEVVLRWCVASQAGVANFGSESETELLEHSFRCGNENGGAG